MGVRPGYKQTEVGPVPKEWHVDSLGCEIERLEAGVSVNSVAEELGHYALDKVILKTSSIFGGRFLPNESKKIAPADISRAKLNPKKGTLIISRMNTPDLVGECGYVAADYPNHFIPDRLWMTRKRKGSEINVQWLGYLLSSTRFKARIKNLATGTSGSMKNIAKDALLAMPIPYPSFSEQRAIATALTDMDALLEGLDRLIAKKRDLKQAAMQQLLTGKTRLPGFEEEWEVKRLGDLGMFLKGSGVKKDDAMSGDLPCIRYGEIYTQHNDYIKAFKSWISLEVAETATKLRRGDLLFAGSGETKEEIGKCIAFADDCEAYAGGDIVILRLLNADSIFLGYYCNTTPVNAQKVSMGQGDAVVHISASALSNIQLAIPGLSEQTAIATILSDMDAEIEALQQRRAKTRDLKQAMMQELLTGKTRLI